MVARNRRRYPGGIRTPRAAYYAWKKEEAEKLLESLRKRSNGGMPIVVEGRRDRDALRKLGVKGAIFCLKGAGESRFQFLEKLDQFDGVIVLTDFDREGRELRLWLYQELTRRGVKADDLPWRRIRSLARTDVRSVEELPGFVVAMDSRARGQRPSRAFHANSP